MIFLYVFQIVIYNFPLIYFGLNFPGISILWNIWIRINEAFCYCPFIYCRNAVVNASIFQHFLFTDDQMMISPRFSTSQSSVNLLWHIFDEYGQISTSRISCKSPFHTWLKFLLLQESRLLFLSTFPFLVKKYLLWWNIFCEKNMKDWKIKRIRKEIKIVLWEKEKHKRKEKKTK